MLNITSFGGIGDGVAPNDSALAAAWAALPSGGGCIYFPAGEYLFTTQFAPAIPNNKFAFSIVGDGDGATILHWSNANGGMKFNWASPLNALSMSDLSLTTGVANGGYAVDLQASFYINRSSIWNSFERVSCYGSDGGNNTFYWTGGIRAHAVSQINFMSCCFYGSLTGQGDGIHLEGDPASGTYGVMYNIDKCFFNCTGTGINYGAYVQGVTVNGCNFNGQMSTAGIQAPVGMAGVLAQLNVTNCQFDCGAIPIYAGTAIDGLVIVANTITVSKPNGVGIYLPASYLFQIGNNLFSGFGGANNTTGVVVGPSGSGTITGNTFKDMALGYNLNAGSTKVVACSNAFNNVAVRYVNNGSGNSVGAAVA